MVRMVCTNLIIGIFYKLVNIILYTLFVPEDIFFVNVMKNSLLQQFMAPTKRLFIFSWREVVKLPRSVALEDNIVGLIAIYAAIVEVEPLNLVARLAH